MTSVNTRKNLLHMSQGGDFALAKHYLYHMAQLIFVCEGLAPLER
jgi:hypothetical protein